MPLTFLLTQTADNWKLTIASESVVIFKPIETEDPTSAICFFPRTDKPEKVYALLQGNESQQELFFQKEIKPVSYLDVAKGMHEVVFQEDDLL